jgi:uncharacterized cupin superfamily protein
MTDRPQPVINLADVPLNENFHGDRFRGKIGSFAGRIGMSGMGAMLHEVPPGKAAFPFHAHHMSPEMFVILEGEGTYRFGDKDYPIKANDVLAAPAGGAEVAHQIVNTGTTVLRYLGISANSVGGDVVEYPDSGKFAVSSRFDWATQSGGVHYVGRQENSLGYWDGEA